METQFEIEMSMPFGNGQLYIVGYDTMLGEVAFDAGTHVCYNNEDLMSEIHRIIEQYHLVETEEITIEEQIIIAEIKLTPNLNYREYTLEKKYK